MWPLIFVVIGVGKLLSTVRAGGSGVWFLFLGGIFLLHTFRILSLSDSWPLFVVVAGLSMMFPKSRRCVRREGAVMTGASSAASCADSDHSPCDRRLDGGRLRRGAAARQPECDGGRRPDSLLAVRPHRDRRRQLVQEQDRSGRIAGGLFCRHRHPDRDPELCVLRDERLALVAAGGCRVRPDDPDPGAPRQQEDRKDSAMVLRRQHGRRRRTVGRQGGGTMEQSLSEFAIWSGLQRRVASPAFRRAELTAIMGGIELDLRQAGTENGEAVIDVFVMWGGIEITVPPDWAVSNQVTPILGGAEDKSTGTQQARHRLVVKGVVIMGGVDIKA